MEAGAYRHEFTRDAVHENQVHGQPTRSSSLKMRCSRKWGSTCPFSPISVSRVGRPLVTFGKWDATFPL